MMAELANLLFGLAVLSSLGWLHRHLRAERDQERLAAALAARDAEVRRLRQLCRDAHRFLTDTDPGLKGADPASFWEGGVYARLYRETLTEDRHDR